MLGDMAPFDLGRTFAGAVRPVNTLMHLGREELAPHLEATAAALAPGARYLVQLGLFDEAPKHVSQWEAERDGTRPQVTWAPEARDEARGIELHRSTIEVLSGPRAGEVHEEEYEMTYWTPAAWRSAVAASPFAWEAVYDGDRPERRSVDSDAQGGLLWHELMRR